MTADLRYPIWTLIDSAHGVASMSCKGVGKVMHIFSTFELASRFLQAVKITQLTPHPLQYPQQIIDAINHCERGGAQYVIINNDFGASPPGEVYPLAEFRRAIRTRISDFPPSAN